MVVDDDEHLHPTPDDAIAHDVTTLIPKNDHFFLTKTAFSLVNRSKKWQKCTLIPNKGHVRDVLRYTFGPVLTTFFTFSGKKCTF